MCARRQMRSTTTNPPNAHLHAIRGDLGGAPRRPGCTFTSTMPTASPLAAADASASSSASADSSINWRAVAALAACNGAHFFTICSLFPYAGFLAVDNGWADDVDSAGNVAGFLATFTLLARIPTSIIWGVAADRFGSKACVEASLVAIAAGSVTFGLSTSLWASCASRAVFLGALNGWPTLTGVTVGEVGGERGQAQVASRIIGSGAIFGLIGPSVGGWTYASVPSLPSALPPNIIGALFAFAAAALVHCWLPTATTPKGAGDGGSRRSGSGSNDAQAGEVASTSTYAALCTRPLPLVLYYRASVGFFMYCFWDVFPLFGIASEGVGGLALGHAALGSLIAVAAVLQITYECGSSLLTTRSATWHAISPPMVPRGRYMMLLSGHVIQVRVISRDLPLP